MTFEFSLGQETLINIMRKCGYAPEGQDQKTGELKFWRSAAGRRFPRFHLYVSGEDKTARCSLHLDQKAPSYRGTARHSGEYEGPLLEQEATRLLSRVKDNS